MAIVLVIEDHEDVRENIEELLELAGYETLGAENGKVGVQLAREKQPDLILCDVMMPELDGFGVLNILNRDSATSTIPFVFLTAKTEKADLRKGMSLGATDYLTKPFEEDELLDTVALRLKKADTIKSAADGGLHHFLSGRVGGLDMDALLKDAQVKTYKAQQELFAEGDSVNYVYQVMSGQVKLTKMSDFGRELITEMAVNGDFYGHIAALQGSHHIESALTLSDCEIRLIPLHAFKELLESHREVANHFISLLAKNVADNENRMLSLAYAHVRQRVAEVILKMEANDSVQLSREEMASLAGTATESLIRNLSDFKSDGLIISEGKKLIIKDRKGLMRVAGV